MIIYNMQYIYIISGIPAVFVIRGQALMWLLTSSIMKYLSNHTIMKGWMESIPLDCGIGRNPVTDHIVSNH